MTDTPMLSEAQMRHMAPYFPRSRGLPRVDDRRVRSGIVRDQERPALTRRAGRLWPTRGPLRLLGPLEPGEHHLAYLRRAFGQGRPGRAVDDRRHAPEGAPHRCEPA